MQKVLPHSDRVRAALSTPITSAELSALIEDTQREVETNRERLAQAKAKAVDPLSTDAAAAEARRLHHDLGFEDERHTSSVARLKHRLEAVLNAEAEAVRRAAYDAVAQDQAVLAEKLRDRYPVLASEITDLLGEVQALNERTRAVNQAPPTGAEWLHPVEHLARGPVTATYAYGPEPMYERPGSLVRSVMLPKFDSMEAKGLVGYLWVGLEKAD